MIASRILLSSLLLNLIISHCVLSQGHEENDYQQWTESFRAGELDKVIAATERDLDSAKPNALSSLSWLTAHQIKDDVATAIGSLDGNSKTRLLLLKDIIHYDEENMALESAAIATDQLRQHADIYGQYLWSNMNRNIDPSLSYELLFNALEKYGEHFRLVWSFDYLSINHTEVFDRLQSDLSSGRFDNYPAVKAFLNEASSTPYQKSLDDLQTVDAYLQQHPKDANALRFKAHQLRDLKQYQNAAEIYLTAWELDPYYAFGLNLTDAANAFARDGNVGEAKVLIDKYAKLYYPKSAELESALRLSEILLAVGRNNEARALLESSKQFEASPAYQLALGHLEKASSRPAFAIKHYEQAYRSGPKTVVYAAALTDAYLASEKPAAALEIITRLENERALPIDFYYKKAKVYEDSDEFEEAYQVRKESVTRYPASSWHWNNYAYICSKTGRNEDAYNAINKSIALSNPTAWTAARLYDYTLAKANEAQALRELEQKAISYPWNENLWKAYANKFKTVEDKVAAYAKVLELATPYFHGYQNLIDTYLDAGRWEEAGEVLQRGKEALKKPDDLKQLTYYEAEIIRRKGQREKLSQQEIRSAINATNRYATLVGSKDGYWYRDMAAFMIYKNDPETSAIYLDSGLMVAPDSRPIMSKIRNDNLKEFGVGKFSRKMWEYVQRDPFDINRYVDAIDFHVKWGGSPLVAIVLSQQAKELIPDGYSKVSRLEVMAYGNLGDNAKDFELRYAKENVISSSERYINWYNTSRHQVWEGSSKISIDASTTTATIQFPDGTIAQRQDDLVTGRVKMLQVGNAYIKADYDENGLLLMLHASNGRNVALGYDENHKIESISTGDGNDMLIEYNENGKTSKLTLKGVGRIEVTYDEFEDVDQIASFDTNGKEAGTQLTMRVTSTFQELTSLADVLQKAQTLSNAQLPDLGIEDEQYESLYSGWYALQDDLYEKENSKKRLAWFKQSLALASYLKDNTHINADYANACAGVITETREELKLHKSGKTVLYGPQLAAIFHELLIKTRRNGVASDWWSEWIETQEWLEKEKLAETKLTPYRIAIEKVQEEFKNQPVELLATSEWLPKSILQNEGYWKNFSIKTILDEKYHNNMEINTLYKRYNGDILIGTNKGLLVRHLGFWDHVAFAPLRMAMERDLAPEQIKASSNILSIAESEGMLALGTADGLVIWQGEGYMGKVKGRYSQLDGLPVSAISSLGIQKGQVFMGTSQGLFVLSNDQIAAHPQVTNQVQFMHQHQVRGSNVNITIGTNDQLWVIDEQGVAKSFANERVEDALISQEGDLYMLNNNRVFRFDNDVFVELYGNIITTDANQTYGLAQVPVTSLPTGIDEEFYFEDFEEFGEDYEEDLEYEEAYTEEYEMYETSDQMAIGVLTDMGLSLYHDKHFEHFELPLKDDLIPQARKFAGRDDGFAIHTGEDIYVFEKDQVTLVDDGKVNDLLTSDELGKTFIAKPSGLYYVDHDDPSLELLLVDYITPDALALDRQGRLITNDGLQLVRYQWSVKESAFEREDLFYANQYEASDANWIKSGDIKNIVIAQDEVIWVATKLSIFRYDESMGEDSNVEEYNYFRAPKKFPSRTHMVYRVLETPDGRIWAVCSNEGHLSYNGIYLKGGLLEWDNGKNEFTPLDINNNYAQRGFNWFVTSITPTEQGNAIVGTLGGFAEYNQGEIKDYYGSGGGIANSSYNAIYERYPSLFMGTRGDRLGDMWFFGSAAGVLAYRNGVWIYPDRINQMLPQDQEFGNYGGRHVNAIATDMKGHLYVGTDLGLLIYDSQGADPMSFLINNGRVDDAFSAQNEMQLQSERDAVIKSIPQSTPSGKIIAELESVDTEIRKLEQLKANGQKEMLERSEVKHINADSLTSLINERNKRHYELLLRLEKQDPALHQLLDVKPVEVAALRKKLREGECLIQYIPTSNKLYIQVLARDKVELREVRVAKDSLMRMSQYVATGIKLQMGMEELGPKLEWLYDVLLRPIENEISDYDHAMVIPIQSLYYLPFSALLDRTSERSSQYALERFNIAYVSSTYLLGLLMQSNVEATDRYLLFGDPDGTLPGAGAEVRAIGEITASNNLFMNKQASLTNLIKNASGSKVVHLATHGYLDERSPEESSILLADNNLTMPQIFNLPLDKTEMIVLSACETGKGGGKGMEYATMARAFANAGAPTVVATLWKVDDAATQEIMVDFYGALKKGDSKLGALTGAQRNFAKQPGEKSHPYYWAGFILMGKP
ncbi:MAG: CHAT domain-containing protein [Cyclobacteriaceae bacterium]